MNAKSYLSIHQSENFKIMQMQLDRVEHSLLIWKPWLKSIKFYLKAITSLAI